MNGRVGTLPIALIVCASVLTSAQAAKNYRGRMAPVPMTAGQQSTIAGVGAVQAVLKGSSVTVSGTFEGLRSPATIAQIHRAPRGIRGPVILELKVAKTGDGTTGTIAGTFDLTPTQVADLDKGWWYVQLHSERAAEGNLWGWLMLQEKK